MHHNVSDHKRNIIIRSIRYLLVIGIIFHTGMLVYDLIVSNSHTFSGRFNAVSRQVELLLWSLLTLVLCYIPDMLDRGAKVHLPVSIEATIVTFIYASIFVSVRFDLYYRFFWWDDLLHTMSGVIIGYLGVICIYIINKKYSMNLSPALIAVFAFTFAVTMGVMWEVFEFIIDVFFGTANQKWDLPSTSMLMGKPYQGSGLRDTMSDLIVDAAGALFASVNAYFIYKKDRKKALNAMKEIFPE
ncbi:MAG: hypothetical protein LLG37_10205 [Spirochaetia bacterium]|nr:hypothetical protein [Spirochaetia bacterium]